MLATRIGKAVRRGRSVWRGSKPNARTDARAPALAAELVAQDDQRLAEAAHQHGVAGLGGEAGAAAEVDVLEDDAVEQRVLAVLLGEERARELAGTADRRGVEGDARGVEDDEIAARQRVGQRALADVDDHEVGLGQRQVRGRVVGADRR